MHTILVPVDGSNHALKALDHAITLINDGLKADIHLINIQPSIVPFLELPLYDYALFEESQQSQANKILNTAGKLLEKSGIKYTKHFEIGPVYAIVDYAKAQKCDMIVMGTRGMGPFLNLILGSTANLVVHMADIPVTLIK